MKEMKDLKKKKQQESESKMVCPLIYDKIDLAELNKKAKPNDNNQYFYDKISKKFVHVFNEGIYIYNSSCSKVKKAFPFKLGKDNIVSVTVDKQEQYMLLLTETPNNFKLLLGVKLKTESTIGMVKDKEPFDYLLGMFFISNYETNEKNVIKDFCLVFPQRIKIYNISPVTDLINEVASINQTNTMNTNFHYNLKCSVLCCEKDNYSLSLHNLSQQVFYKNEHNIKLPKRSLLRKSLTNYFTNKDEKSECLKIIQTLNTKGLKYKRSQIFLEVISFQLFLINFSFEENKLFLYSVANLEAPDLKFEIDFRQHSYYSSLQFIDNLIVCYNFFKKETSIYDIGSIKQNMIQYSLKNEYIPYDKEIIIHGKLIIEKDLKHKGPPVFYYVSFCKTILYDMTPPHLKHNAIISLFMRKKSKAIIFGYLRQMILGRYKSKHLRLIYAQIVDQLKVVFVEDKPNEENDKAALKSNEIIKPTDYMFIGQSCSIKQGDIMMELFKTFETETGVEELAIENMISFYHCLNARSSPVLPCFHIILIIFIQKLPISKLLMLLRTNELPESFELAKYILEAKAVESKDQRALELFGLDILLKLGKIEDAFEYLFLQNRLEEAMFLLLSKGQQQNGNILTEKINEILMTRVDLVEANVDLLLQYFNEELI